MRRTRLPRFGNSTAWLPVVITGILVLAACAPAAPPPTAAPAKPAEASKPAPAKAEAGKPAESKPEASKPAAASPVASPAAASPVASPAAAAKPGELTQLQLALATNLNYVPVFVAIEKGIFNKHGLDLKIRPFATGVEATKAVQAGEVELAVANFSTLISARASGAPLKGFWLFENDATAANNDQNIVLIVPPNSPVQKVADLAGKKIGNTVAGAYDPWLKIHLRAAGVDVNSVQIQNVPFPNMPSALKAGGLDAAVFQEPYAQAYLNDMPNGRVLVRGGGLVSFRVLATVRDDWLPKNQAVAEKFAVAMAEASQYTRQRRDEGAEIATRWITGLDLAVAKKAMPFYTYDPRLSKLVIASWDQDATTLLEEKRITQKMPISEGFDMTLPEQLLQKYPQLYSDLPPLP